MKDVLRQPGPSPLQLRALAIVDDEERRYVSRARRMVGDSEADEAVQDLRVQVLMSCGLPQAEDELRRYLSRMMTYVAYQRRENNRDSRIEHREYSEAHLKLIEESLSDEANADEDFGPVDLEFRREFLRERAAALPPKCGQVFTQVVCDRIAIEAVAAQMGTALATARSHFQCAVRAMKKILRGENS